MLKLIAKLYLAIKTHVDAIELDLEGSKLYLQAKEAGDMLLEYQPKVPELEGKIKITHGEELKEVTTSLAQALTVVTNAGNAQKNFLNAASAKRLRAAELRQKVNDVLKS